MANSALNFPTDEELYACTDFLSKNPQSVKKWLNVADKYMQTLVANPEMFLLPKSHGFLKPVISRYAKDIDGFSRYLLELRDMFSTTDLAWEHVQTVYRRVNGRFVQQTRRERSHRAIAKASELYGKPAYHSRMQWVSDLEHTWANRRLMYLDDYRNKMKGDRIDVDTRAELLGMFWEIIDTEIFEGKGLPPWN
mgnify:CR=1 FL=1|tara:strand:+ start:4 stop:585 length:582 start_codon:yes stop_codon:yes gene_type:complete